MRPISQGPMSTGSQLLGSSSVSTRADSRFAPSQWETASLCNDVSHWQGASPEWAQSLLCSCRRPVSSCVVCVELGVVLPMRGMHDCWCPGSPCCQAISNHDILCVHLACCRLPCELNFDSGHHYKFPMSRKATNMTGSFCIPPSIERVKMALSAGYEAVVVVSLLGWMTARNAWTHRIAYLAPWASFQYKNGLFQNWYFHNKDKITVLSLWWEFLYWRDSVFIWTRPPVLYWYGSKSARTGSQPYSQHQATI